MDERAGKVDIERCLAEGRSVRFPILGWSMYPLLRDGDEVLVVPADGRELRRGDVALYRRAGGPLVLHRVCRADASGLCFVGDNQREIEGPLPRGQVRGVMTAFFRDGNRVDCADRRWRALAKLWLLARPVRPALAKAVHALRPRG